MLQMMAAAGWTAARRIRVTHTRGRHLRAPDAPCVLIGTAARQLDTLGIFMQTMVSLYTTILGLSCLPWPARRSTVLDARRDPCGRVGGMVARARVVDVRG